MLSITDLHSLVDAPVLSVQYSFVDLFVLLINNSEDDFFLVLQTFNVVSVLIITSFGKNICNFN